MATSGKKHWPPMGRTQWPLTRVLANVVLVMPFMVYLVLPALTRWADPWLRRGRVRTD